MTRAGRKRQLGRAVVNRQVHGNLRNTDGPHHAIAGVEQALIFRVFGAGGVAGVV